MATRSAIGIETDGKIVAIYCHWDGYIEHNGEILYRHYQTPEKILALIALGDLSSLGAEIGEKHDFDSRTHTNWCTYYGRDRGEAGVECRQFATSTEMIRGYSDCEYFYLWSQGEWKYSTRAAWHSLKDAVESIDAERAQ